ncbi:MAG: glycosyltransferase family protein [Romboutsia sp.]|uniref:glycosyltransferase family protein n=1 Tax=Romboutsia sp. TaxID=1965302 RepID=UPI003F2D6571
MNNKKICFITAVNNDLQYNQCLFVIKLLKLPKDFELETIFIKNATSMCSAYNQAMEKSDAKYKVYIHQDTILTDMDFVQKVLDIFNDDSIGMIGVCGAKKLHESGLWWESKNKYGKVLENGDEYLGILFFDEIENNYETVDAIDGLIMITQYDIKWREDIFDGWHFYDISQCFEFKKEGYKIAIPKQDKPWCIHTRNKTPINIYEKYREKFVLNYLKNKNSGD